MMTIAISRWVSVRALLVASLLFAGCASGPYIDSGPLPSDALQAEDVDEPPILRDGIEGLHRRIVYPPDAKRKGISGLVKVEFVVGADGKVMFARVAEGLDPEVDLAAVDAVRRSRFTPAMKEGEPVAVVMQIPVTFRLISTQFRR